MPKLWSVKLGSNLGTEANRKVKIKNSLESVKVGVKLKGSSRAF